MDRFHATLHMPTSPLIELLMGIGIMATGVFLLRGVSLVTLFFLPVLHVPLGVFCLILGALMTWAAWGDVRIPRTVVVLRLPVYQLLLRLWCMRVSALCWAYVTLVAILFRIEQWQFPFTIETTFFTLHTILNVIISLQLAIEYNQERGGCVG